MSGTYSAGSNIVVPGRASGAANTGNGTITNLVQTTTAVISDMGSGTSVGSNVVAQLPNSPILSLPTTLNISAYTKASVNLSGTYIWSEGLTVLELSNTTTQGTGLVINLPIPQRDGEIRILSSTNETFPSTSLTLSGATVKGTTANIVTPSVALRMIWDMASPYWVRI